MLLAGCTTTPAMPRAVVAWGPVAENPAMPVTPVMPAMAIGQGATASQADHAHSVRLTGIALVPALLEGAAANVHEGRVVGSPVRLEDPRSGRLLARGVTYYDGSFQLDVPVGEATVPGVLTVDLMPALSEGSPVTLALPLSLSQTVHEEHAPDLSVGSTALIALYRQMAASDAAPATRLANLVANTTPDVVNKFAEMAERAPVLGTAHDLPGLRDGLAAYVAEATTR